MVGEEAAVVKEIMVMIRFVWVLMLLLSLPCSAGAERKDAPAKKGNNKAAQEQALQALKDGEHMKQTPFGQMKQGPAKKLPEPDMGRFVEVEEQGDTIIFRRSTPFGKQVWKRQRGQLSDVEKKMLQRQQKTHQAAKPAKGDSAKSSRKEAGK